MASNSASQSDPGNGGGSLTQKIKDKMTNSRYSFYLGSSLAGLVRTTVGFPFEHPIDSIKTQW